MRRTVFLISIFILALADGAVADNLSFTVAGYGGLSPAENGVSDNSFWWAATNTPGAAVPGSALTNYGFDPLSGVLRGNTPAPYASNDLYTGSLLLSTPFTVSGTQGLTVIFGDLAVQKFAWDDFTFAALVQNSQVVSILGLDSPMSISGTAEQAYLGTVFAPLSPGVQMTVDYQHGAYPNGFQLGNIQYNQCSADQAGPCQTELTSTYTPAAGTYQLLFGAFGQGRNGPVAVAVKSVTVSEEKSIIYLLVGLLIGCVFLLCRKPSS